MIYAGSAPNAAPVVRSVNIENGFPAGTDIAVADPSFAGGVRVASADFTGDGVPDVVSALGPGGTPTVRVFDALTGEPVPGTLGSFPAFESTFAGGVSVAAADVNGDGTADIIAGAGAGGGPVVRVFSGVDGTQLMSFLAFESTFAGGVTVAAADFTGDGKAELVVGAGVGGGPRVRVFDPTTGNQVAGPLGSFFAFDPSAYSGAAVGAHFKAGDVDADGTADLVVGTQSGPASRVKVYSGATGGVLADFAPFGPGVGAAVSVGVAYIDDDAAADVVVGAQDATAAVRVFAGETGMQIAGDAGEFVPFEDAAAGVTIAAGCDPQPAWQEPVMLPVVSVRGLDPTAAEAGLTTGAFVFSRAEIGYAPLTVKFAVRTGKGDATPGGDYQLREGVVTGPVVTVSATIPAGELSVPVLVKPFDDTAAEGTERVFVTIAADPDVYTPEPDHDYAWVDILDDDYSAVPVDGESGETGSPGGGGPGVTFPENPSYVPTVFLTAADGAASEDGKSTGAFRVVRSSSVVGAIPSWPLTVSYKILTDGEHDATPDDDYTGLDHDEFYALTHTVTIPAGMLDYTFAITPVDDQLVEGTERVALELTGGGYNIDWYSKLATVLIAETEKINFDLDVNANGSLKDPVDLAKNYLPGYEGDEQRVSVGANFNTDSYITPLGTGQWMRLILDGIGSDSKTVSKIEFTIQDDVTQYEGYCSNRDAVIYGKDDYSFNSYPDDRIEIVDRTSSCVKLPSSHLYYGGKMEPTQTWVAFVAKDYGAFATVQAKIYSIVNGVEQVTGTVSRRIPQDENNDKIADKWQNKMAERWRSQYGDSSQGVAATEVEIEQAVAPTADLEMRDPDRRGPRVPQAEAGDGHTVLEEYRGYILDGGGFDGHGVDQHCGGHIRLDPARKEILTEVDRNTTLNGLPASVPEILDDASKAFSNNARGTGIYMYYLMDKSDLNILPAGVVDIDSVVHRLRETRNQLLMSDFLHIVFINDGLSVNIDAIGYTAGRPTTAWYGLPANGGWTVQNQIQARGTIVSTSDVDREPVSTCPNRLGLFSTVVAHELRVCPGSLSGISWLYE